MAEALALQVHVGRVELHRFLADVTVDFDPVPTPVAGLEFTFIVVAAQTLTLDVGGSVVVALGKIATSAGGNVSSSSPYSALTLKAVSSTLWVATFLVGTWTPT
jgi:hypothetical protein